MTRILEAPDGPAAACLMPHPGKNIEGTEEQKKPEEQRK
jgi:hypothetical protein